MVSGLFLYRRRLRKGPRFLRRPCLYRRTAPAPFSAAISVSRGKGLSRRPGTFGLPIGVQHEGEIGAHAAESALSIFFFPLRSAFQFSEMVAKYQLSPTEQSDPSDS